MSGAALYGISGRSNREQGRRTHWGKNEFNSSFPTALICYMDSRSVMPIYLTVRESLKVRHGKISVGDLFGIKPTSDKIYYAFEETFAPYQKYVIGSLQRSDLVVMDKNSSEKPHMSAFEIKLTALPDHRTLALPENKYSCELVFRPPAIEQLALSLIRTLADERVMLRKKLKAVCSAIYNWRRAEDILPHAQGLLDSLDDVLSMLIDKQRPFAIQPVWKTKGKKATLAEDCLDVFVWSDLAFTRLFVDRSRQRVMNKMDRPLRAALWLLRMLWDFAESERIDSTKTVSEMAFGLQTDKAFSIDGKGSYPYLHGPELTHPRIKKAAISEIILGGGQNLLSPERRFDAIIVNTPGLFE